MGQGYILTPVCHSVHRVGGVWLRGVCMVAGGMHGWEGACMVGGHVWLTGGHAWLGGMHGWGMLGWGGHMWLQGGMHGCGGAYVVAGGVHGLGGMHGWGACMVVGDAWLKGGVHRIRPDTVNGRAVRILLECILVQMVNLLRAVKC